MRATDQFTDLPKRHGRMLGPHARVTFAREQNVPGRVAASDFLLSRGRSRGRGTGGGVRVFSWRVGRPHPGLHRRLERDKRDPGK